LAFFSLKASLGALKGEKSHLYKYPQHFYKRSNHISARFLIETEGRQPKVSNFEIQQSNLAQ